MCIISTLFQTACEPVLNVGCFISRKAEVKGQAAFEIDLCQANEFSSVKSEVL